MGSPIAWLAARTPPAPEELRAWLDIPDHGADSERGVGSVVGALLERALVHLHDAVGRPGRDREAAHRLLAADALITYACEAASEATDVRGALLEVFVGVRTGGKVE